MQLIPLDQVASQLTPGDVLPWGVRDASGRLLLARGHLIKDASVVQTLLERGMFVDAEEARGAARQSQAAPEGYFSRWRKLHARYHVLMQGPVPDDLRTPVEEVARAMVAMGDEDPDKMLFEILRHDTARLQSYGISHALHSAAVCLLTVRRLGWAEPDRRRLVCAALTMNLTITELQGRLAAQEGALTPEQRAQIRAHPEASARLLQERGVSDPGWLLAVLQHHERPDGKGYPTGTTTPSELAQVLSTADVFTAKLAGRAGRQPLLPHQAARDLFVARKGHPSTEALIKEFGIYPPGSFVKLASGETGVVVRRGQNANAPMVATITRANGAPTGQPVQRDSASKEFAIVTALAPSNVMARVPWELLYGE